MKNTADLMRIADENVIPVLYVPIPENGSLCLQTQENQCYIGIDSSILKNEPSRLVHLAHELGHCVTGAFYNRWSKTDVRQKHENTADKWAIVQLISKEELEAALAAGHTELWELAEYFNVTEDFIKKVVCWYMHGNLDVDSYFGT